MHTPNASNNAKTVCFIIRSQSGLVSFARSQRRLFLLLPVRLVKLGRLNALVDSNRSRRHATLRRFAGSFLGRRLLRMADADQRFLRFRFHDDGHIFRRVRYTQSWIALVRILRRWWWRRWRRLRLRRCAFQEHIERVTHALLHQRLADVSVFHLRLVNGHQSIAHLHSGLRSSAAIDHLRHEDFAILLSDARSDSRSIRRVQPRMSEKA